MVVIAPQGDIDLIGIVTTLEGDPLQSGDIANRLGGFADILEMEDRDAPDSAASLRTFRCWETAGLVMSKCPAISPAESSPSRTSVRIWRLRGPAIAFSAASTAA